MNELRHPDWERLLEARLRRQLEVAVRPFDPGTVARHAADGGGEAGRRAGLGVATVLVGGMLAVVAIQLFGVLGRPSGEPAFSSPVSQQSPQPAATASAPVSCPATPTGAASSPAAEILDPNGILLVALGEQVQAAPPCEEVALAFDHALRIAMAHPMDFGYPWIDPATYEVVFSPITAEGRALADDAGAAMTVPHRIREVEHTYAELEHIKDDVTFLRDRGVVDAELIFKVVPDERDNRTLVVISAMSQPLLNELADRYDPDAIAVQVDPNPPRAGY